MNRTILSVFKQSFCIKQVLSKPEGQVFNFPCIAANISILFLQCLEGTIQITGTETAKGSREVCNINLN